MDSQLQNYLNRDLRGVIAGLTVVQGKAKETGNIYYAVEISFINGYKKRLFLRSDEEFAWINAFDQLQTQNTLDKEF